ncbi:MAG: EAL domain-containing protein [Vibrio sp.]|uniref:EAL domain-containing protein n=1 Tax=Vibrio TaxID=662 RepID=UPI001EB216F6|nr:EAL domain-containing protein [Vibrio sp.]NRB68957.1 EAL domain-containing protein [Vibrio sp.]
MLQSDKMIEEALDMCWYTCHYQPKVEPSLNHIVGVEVLFRLDIPEIGIIPPNKFIQRAFELGHEERIFFIVLEQALRDIKYLPDHLSLAINITEAVISNPDNASRIFELLKNYRFSPSRLVLELSEHDGISQDLSSYVDIYQSSNIKISIDDFGIGYSNINKIINLNIDELKFDKSLINNSRKTVALLLKSILNFCQEVGIKTVAEGVEDAKTRALVERLGFDSYQGFYYSRPVSIQELGATIATFLTHQESDEYELGTY